VAAVRRSRLSAAAAELKQNLLLSLFLLTCSSFSGEIWESQTWLDAEMPQTPKGKATPARGVAPGRETPLMPDLFFSGQ
jgi:hypothetical protein